MCEESLFTWPECIHLKILVTSFHTLVCAVLSLVAQSCLTLCNRMDCSPPGSSVHGDSPGKNTGVVCHALLQRIFLAQGQNPHLMSPALAGRFFYHQRHLGKVKGESCSGVSDSLLPHGLYSPWNSPGHGLEWIAFPFSGDLPNPGIKSRSSTLQVDSLPAEPQGKPQNTGVGSLSLLQ